MTDTKDESSWLGVVDLFAVSPDAVGKRIREARLTKKLSLADLGSCVGRSSQAVQQWEVGESEPGLERLMVLAKHLGVEPIWLIMGVRALVNQDWVQKQRELARLKSDDEYDEDEVGADDFQVGIHEVP